MVNGENGTMKTGKAIFVRDGTGHATLKSKFLLSSLFLVGFYFLLLHIKPVCETMLKTIIKNGCMKIVNVALFGKIFAFHSVMLFQSPLFLNAQTDY